jgi:hypothetical protein
MSDTDEHDQNDDAGLEISDEDAERLLEDPEDEGSDSDDTDDSGERRRPDKDAAANSTELSKWKSLARKHEREAKARAAKLREYEDANKSEAQRLQDSASEFKTRAEKAESALRRREIAEERAPAHATLAQIKAVAKRLSGDDDEALEGDADELFALLVPAAPKESPPKTSQRPKERLRPGNTDPEEDDEETDPRKLADSIRRNR